MMSDAVRDKLAASYPAENVMTPSVGDLWARGRRERHRRTLLQAAGATASIIVLAGVGVMYGLPEAVTGPPPAPQIGSDDLPAVEPGADDEPRDGDGRAEDARWDVCDYADHADADVDASRSWERNIAMACEQVLTGQQPDRPDIVACYSRTDEPGGSLAGEIAHESCDQLANSDIPIPVDEVDNLARSRPHDVRREALSAWQTTPAPDAVQLLDVDPGEPAWYASGDTTDLESRLAYGLAAWDDRLGADADTVCAWIAEEVAAVIDDGAAITTDDADTLVQDPDAELHQAVTVVLDSALEGTVGDGLAGLVVERCDP